MAGMRHGIGLLETARAYALEQLAASGRNGRLDPSPCVRDPRHADRSDGEHLVERPDPGPGGRAGQRPGRARVGAGRPWRSGPGGRARRARVSGVAGQCQPGRGPAAGEGGGVAPGRLDADADSRALLAHLRRARHVLGLRPTASRPPRTPPHCCALSATPRACTNPAWPERHRLLLACRGSRRCRERSPTRVSTRTDDLARWATSRRRLGRRRRVDRAARSLRSWSHGAENVAGTRCWRRSA